MSATRDSMLADPEQLVADLHALGVKRVEMLTGDTEETARVVADMVGVDGFKAALLPDQKTAEIAQQVDSGATVMMVGDGVNDAPSLARASVAADLPLARPRVPEPRPIGSQRPRRAHRRHGHRRHPRHHHA